LPRPAPSRSHSSNADEDDDDADDGVRYPSFFGGAIRGSSKLSNSTDITEVYSERRRSDASSASTDSDRWEEPEAVRKSRFKRRGVSRLGTQAHGSIHERLDLMSKTLFKADRHQYLQIAYAFVDDPESSVYAWLYAQFLYVFWAVTSFLCILQTTEPPLITDPLTETILFATFDALFLCEVLSRFILCPNHKAFFCSYYNWIDMLAAAPILVRSICPGFRTPLYAEHGDSMERLVLVCVAPILRLLKFLRHFEKIHVLRSAFAQSMEALPVLLYIYIILALVFSVLIYFVEPRNNIPTFPQAIWLSIVTMTTVGYGDIVPVDYRGFFVVSVLVITSMLFMAMPLGIIGSAFTEVWSNRDAVLLISRTREHLVKWGYSAQDIPLLFAMADSDGDGELELDEFTASEFHKMP
jgi:hypothetical protein